MRWLMQRWWFWGGAAFTLVVVVMGYLFIPVQQRISQANCDRTQLGWSLGQVKEVLGEPEEFVAEISAPIRDWNAIVWQDEDGNAIFAYFDERGMCAKNFLPSELSFSEKLKRRIRRQIRPIWP
jgi:hypothetical protein